MVQGDVGDVHLSRCQSTRYIGLLGALPRVCMPLAGTEVTISLHSGIGWRRTAIGFEAGNAIEVAAPQVSVHSDCIPGRLGPLLYFITSVTLHLSWELLTGRYGEDSGGGGGGARLCDVETGD